MKFVKLMTSGIGRTARIIMGLVLMSVGSFVIQGTPGTIMTAVALLPIAGGIFDFCLAGLALGYPVSGAAARKKLAGA